MKIAVGCDEAAYVFKERIKEHLQKAGHTVEDFGVYNEDPVLYPDIAYAAAKSVAEGNQERAILMCGTGIGMCITANKVPGIRAAVCHDPYSAERSRKSNDAQIMCMGARVIGVELAKTLADIWMGCSFAGGASADKVERISYYEKQ